MCVLESYSLMNAFLEGEQLLQVQLEISRKCQLQWSFEVPWGECSHLCNLVVLFGQTVSITWHLTEGRARHHLCSWLHAFPLPEVWKGLLWTVHVIWCGGTCSPLAQLHSTGLAASRSPMKRAALSAVVGSGFCFLSSRSIACLV